MDEFIIKASGERKEYESGMKRSPTTGRPRYDLMDKDMLYRWAMLLAKGAEVHGERNHEKACTQEEVDRFKESAFRHFMDYIFDVNTGEDNAAATIFNIAGIERTRKKMKAIEEANEIPF